MSPDRSGSRIRTEVVTVKRWASSVRETQKTEISFISYCVKFLVNHKTCFSYPHTLLLLRFPDFYVKGFKTFTTSTTFGTGWNGE